MEMGIEAFKESCDKLSHQLKKIKVFLSDVDGVLTNGLLFFQGPEMGYNRFFNALDGHGFKYLKEANIKVGVITGGHSYGVKKRFADLNLDFLYFGNEDKRFAFKEILSQGYAPENIAYIGDDFIDLPILKKVGLAVTVPHASFEVKHHCHYVTYRKAGEGAGSGAWLRYRHLCKALPKIFS